MPQVFYLEPKIGASEEQNELYFNTVSKYRSGKPILSQERDVKLGFAEISCCDWDA